MNQQNKIATILQLITVQKTEQQFVKHWNNIKDTDKADIFLRNVLRKLNPAVSVNLYSKTELTLKPVATSAERMPG